MFRNTLLLLVAAGIVACGPSQHVEAAKKAASMSDRELKEMVDRLFVDDDPNRENFHTLLAAGKRADPFLIRVLDEPRTQTAVFAHEGFDFTGDSPFHRICDLLANTAPTEAVTPLTKYLQHPNQDFRNQAAWVLGRIGTAEALEPMKTALADPEPRVREAALIGIDGGLKKGRRSEPFLSGIFPVVAALLKDDKYFVTAPATVLARIDLNKAAPLLESAECFTTGNPQLWKVLEALNRDGHKTPHAILLPLLKELAPQAATNGRRGLEFAAALRLYARNPDANAEGTFRSLLDSPSDSVATGAASALEILADIDTAAVLSMGHDGKFATMTVPQRYYFAISEYHYEVCNGGHDQFFGNSSGNIYPTALEGLRAIGAHTKAAILEQALSGFGAERASTDRTTRQVQMERRGGFAERIFKLADNGYFESEKKPGERVEVLLSLFAINYRADFARKNGSPE